MNGNGKTIVTVVGLACTIIGLLLGGAGMAVFIRDDVKVLNKQMDRVLIRLDKFEDWHVDHYKDHIKATGKEGGE